MNAPQLDWRLDHGRPAYGLPLIVDTPRGKKDISNWAKDQVRYDFFLALRSGSKEWNARVFVPEPLLKTLKHGRIYTRDELGIAPTWQATTFRMPEKIQFIVERL